jgi:hypothetical protein
MVESISDELLILDPADYAALVASIAFIQGLPQVFQANRAAIPLMLRGHEENPISTIRRLLATCPDQAPPKGTTELAFIADARLRESIRLDIGSATQDLAQGEWKGATVLAGSAVEALLLWALQEHESKNPGAIAAAVVVLKATVRQGLSSNLEDRDWHLHEYVEVAAHLKLISADAAQLVHLTKDFRNLIHPGAAARLSRAPDKSTALTALAAAEAVARDLTPP